MTNQQGAPEALRPITRYEVVDCIDSKHVPAVIPNGAGPWVRYEDHLAALAGAQQPATHVQNPAEIEHVAGDVSKNGAELDMAQQPAPSAAAALPEGWVPLVITHEGQYPEEVAYGPQILMDRLGKWLRKYFDHVVASKAQPSPTPQTDSQPDVDLIARGMRWEDCEALMKESCAQAGVQWDEEKEPQSIAINVMQRLANAAHKVGFKLGLERMAAARAPADSVTAPARGVVSMPASFEAARFSMRRPHGNGCRIAFHFGDAAEGEAWMKAAITATPPAQAADSVLEDAARLDWLDQQREAYGFQDIHEGNRWEISGAYANVREAIDAARKQGANHD